jgi:hypothetical protein
MSLSLLTANHLLQCYRKGVRTGEMARLRYLDKALFSASLDYLKRGGGSCMRFSS